MFNDTLPTTSTLQLVIPWQDSLPTTLSTSLRHWLQDGESLTKRLRQQGALQVQLQQAGILLDAKHSASLASQGCWQRDVLLHVDSQPWVLAWTQWPADDSEFCQQLLQLGERPLGDYLFVDCAMQRVRMEYAAFVWQNQQYWARRSWLQDAQGCRCVVAELFLAQLDWYN